MVHSARVLVLVGGAVLAVPALVSASPLGGGTLLQKTKSRLKTWRTGEKTWDTDALILHGDKPFAIVGRNRDGDFNYHDVGGIHFDADKGTWSLRFRDGGR